MKSGETSYRAKANRTAIQKAPIPNHRLFYTRELSDKHFDVSWHSHDEYQLFLVLQGKGTRFIGNTVKSFEAGDLTFLGPNIPHLWKSDESYFGQRSPGHSHGIVIYINPVMLESMAESEEFQQLAALLTRVRQGMEIYGETQMEEEAMMKLLQHNHGIPGVVQLLRIFETLAHSKEYHLLQEEISGRKAKELETDRINTVYNYVATHFRENITLEEMAGLVSMAPTSFSRFFKNKTSKSFTYFLTELRIKNACNQLINEEYKTILNICFDSGFNTLSNFNHQFKLFTGLNPKEYRRRYLVL